MEQQILGVFEMTTQLEQAARLALEALNTAAMFTPSESPNGRILRKSITALRAALADAALERMAENAKELGLDYDQPAQKKPQNCGTGYCSCIECVMEQPAQDEPFGHVTVRRLSQRFENHTDQYHFYPAGQSPYLDNVDECHAVYTRPQQPAQDEPVAWFSPSGNLYRTRFHAVANCEQAVTPLYTRPQARESQPCPYVVSTKEGTHHCSLSQRKWVGLTESEIIRCSSVSILRFYDAIEAKLKEKNT